MVSSHDLVAYSYFYWARVYRVNKKNFCNMYFFVDLSLQRNIHSHKSWTRRSFCILYQREKLCTSAIQTFYAKMRKNYTVGQKFSTIPTTWTYVNTDNWIYKYTNPLLGPHTVRPNLPTLHSNSDIERRKVFITLKSKYTSHSLSHVTYVFHTMAFSLCSMLSNISLQQPYCIKGIYLKV